MSRWAKGRASARMRRRPAARSFPCRSTRSLLKKSLKRSWRRSGNGPDRLENHLLYLQGNPHVGFYQAVVRLALDEVPYGQFQGLCLLHQVLLVALVSRPVEGLACPFRAYHEHALGGYVRVEPCPFREGLKRALLVIGVLVRVGEDVCASAL